MRPILPRLKASFLLSPAVLLLLVFIGRFAGGDLIHGVGLMSFLGWAAACAVAISYVVTLYVAFVADLLKK